MEVREQTRSDAAGLDTPLWASVEAPRVAAAVIARCDTEAALDELVTALRSVAPVTDEAVVVLDDRSCGGAVERLEALGARVHVRGWTDDFAAARNAVQDLCAAPWLVVIDADEELVDPADLRTRIDEARERDLDGVLVSVRAVAEDGDQQDLLQVRAYRRAVVSWQFPVHNQLTGLRAGRVGMSEARLESRYVGRARADRSLPILLRQAEQHPEQARWAFHLAETYAYVRDADESREWARRCVRLDPVRYPRAWVLLALAELSLRGVDAARTVVSEALEHHPSHPDVWHTLATVALVGWFRAAQNPPLAARLQNTSVRFAPSLLRVVSTLGLPLEFSVPSPHRRLGDEHLSSEAAEE